MAFDDFDKNNGTDNWDEKPKNDGDSGNNYYRQYTTPAGSGTGGAAPQGQPQRDADGSTAKTLGIVGLIVNFCCCQLAGIIIGIIGYSKANRSIKNLGYETSDASTGRVLGIINIVLGTLFLVGSIAYSIFTGVLTGLLAGEGLEAWTNSINAM